MKYIYTNLKDSLFRKGELIINGEIIETPIYWNGLSLIESVDFQYNLFNKHNLRTFLTNAYFLSKGNKIIEELIKRLDNCLHFMDSGGFQLIGNNKLNIDQKQIFEKQKLFNCDIAPQLDYPINLLMNDYEKEKIISKNIKNFHMIYDLNINKEKPIIMPIIQPYTKKIIKTYLKKLREITDINILGLGGIVPILKGNPNYNGFGLFNLIEMLCYIRNKLPNTFIHIFGLNSFVSKIAFLCGIDSVDSNSWIRDGINYKLRIAFNQNLNLDFPFNRENDLLNDCECEICQQFSGKMERFKRFNDKSEEGKLNRINHNLTTSKTEINLLKIDNIKSVLKNSQLWRYYKFINQNIESFNDKRRK